jgi:peptidoglycan hydrolase-like protein with peptidoglycan-binding domain
MGRLSIIYGVCVLGRVKDVLDDDERKMKPLSFALLLGATVLSGMIVYNAFAHKSPRLRISNALPMEATTHMDVAVTADPNNTVVLKYDPLVEETQRELLAAGLYQGMVDGVIGQRTKQAIQRYQQLNGLLATGETSQDLVNQIKFARKVEAAAKFTGSVEPVAEQAALALPPVVPVSISAVKIKKVQVALAGLGYDINTLDGKLNAETRAAILKFQMDNGLNMEGVIDAKLVSALSINSN